MDTSSSSGHVTARTIVVIGLSLMLICVIVVDFHRLWVPIGVFGYGTNLDGIVTGVDDGSPAARAGIVVGDRLDETKMTPQQLGELIQVPMVASGNLAKTFDVIHAGVRRTVTLVSEPEHMAFGDIFGIFASAIGSLIFIGIGASIVLLRPEPATWGFFLFCLGFGPYDFLGVNELVVDNYPGGQITLVAEGLISIAGLAGLLVFALYFLQPTLSRWRQVALFFVPVIAIVMGAIYTIQIINTYVVARPAEIEARIGDGLEALAACVVVVALIDTLVRRHGAERQRIRWVVLGFAVALVASILSTILSTEAANLPFAVSTALGLLQMVAPVTVAYAIVKNRVIDVNFVISRTVVYGILTTVFVGIFAFIDWFVGRFLDQTRWATIAEIAVAISVGFWLNGMHARVDRFVDSVLFRRRHEAERRLARLARGLPHATSSALVDASLVAEPRDALDLTSAALFRRDGDGHYQRAIAAGWSDGMASDLGGDDPLILHLQAERGPLRLSELHWKRGDAPSGGARPALALPIMVRHELDAMVLFGAHRGGEDFDHDELQWLNSLAVAAGAAYDHLEADALRQELARVKHERDAQQAALLLHGLAPVESP